MLYPDIFAGILEAEVPAMLMALTMALVASRQKRRGGSWLARHLPLVLAALVLSADTLLTFTNMQSDAVPLTNFLPLLIAGFALDTPRLPAVRIRHAIPRFVFGIAAGCALFVPPFCSDLAGVWYGARQKAHPNQSRIKAHFSEPRLQSLILYDGSLDIAANGSGYINYVNDGVALLRKYCGPDDRVLNMDMVNPFPYALGWQTPRGGAAAIAFNYTLSAKNRPSFDRFFGDATVVLVPKHPSIGRVYLDPFNALFLPQMLLRYNLAAESDWFRLYKRK